MSFFSRFALFVGAALTAFAQADAPAILQARCTACHGAGQMSGLDLRERETMLKGGTRGPAVVPGKPEDSILFKAVTRQGQLQMPPGRQGLGPEEIEKIRAWIAAGAPWEAAKTAPPAPASWWAFQPLTKPAAPAVKNKGWVKNAIDAFVLSKLEEKGLHPVAEADRRTLIRRVYIDLHGLPPTPEEIEQFVNDKDPDAYEKLVDKLLASPRYGERWGRHWLDVVRYADTGGYETDVWFKNAWRYRDYVIDSFNKDKSYAQFVQEQIAADELWPDNLDLDGSYDIPKQKLENLSRRLGTGMYTIAPVAEEYALFGDQFRSEWQADATEVTGSAFLGLTIGCAKCHDHKFDPILQRDYYTLGAMFAGSEDREIPVTSKITYYEYTRYETKWTIAEQLKERINRLDEAARKRGGGDGTRPARGAAAGGMTPAERDERETLLRQLGDAYMKAPPKYQTANVLGHAEEVPDTYILQRGDFKQRGAKVEPGFLSAFGGGTLKEPSERPFVPQRRKALALWMTSTAQPLLARVMVNRIWQGHFGRGIVGTPNDFGRQGEAPTHPELLDWLTSQFVDNGWSMKAVHRTILLSNKYRMSSAPDASNEKADPENLLLWRTNRQRLDADSLRDSVLAKSGGLNLKAGGPPVAVPLTLEERGGMRDITQWPVAADPAEYGRRSVYLLVKRGYRLPMLETFDAPDPAVSCPRRESSTVAPQALELMNSEFMSEQAAQFAARLKAKYGDAPELLVEGGWHEALGRAPSQEEKDKAIAFLSKSSLQHLCLLFFNMNEFLYVD